jgi:hypothetical protein
VERLFERGVLADPERKIASNRQPGRCCDSGCMVPGAAQMVPLPKPSAARRKTRAAAGTPVKKQPGAGSGQRICFLAFLRSRFFAKFIPEGGLRMTI